MTVHPFPPRNAVLHGDYITILATFAHASVDFVLTDPPYFVRHQSRNGQRIHNDDNAAWLSTAFAAVHRVLKPVSLWVSFYSWSRIDRFVAAWHAAGLRIAGHVVFCSSGSTLVATQDLDRDYLGIEIDSMHHQTAQKPLAGGHSSVSRAVAIAADRVAWRASLPLPKRQSSQARSQLRGASGKVVCRLPGSWSGLDAVQ